MCRASHPAASVGRSPRAPSVAAVRAPTLPPPLPWAGSTAGPSGTRRTAAATPGRDAALRGSRRVPRRAPGAEGPGPGEGAPPRPGRLRRGAAPAPPSQRRRTAPPPPPPLPSPPPPLPPPLAGGRTNSPFRIVRCRATSGRRGRERGRPRPAGGADRPAEGSSRAGTANFASPTSPSPRRLVRAEPRPGACGAVLGAGRGAPPQGGGAASCGPCPAARDDRPGGRRPLPAERRYRGLWRRLRPAGGPALRDRALPPGADT
ncbi:uncharacterized protein LOC142059576 [Phalacrocorax aristotelis]|uniref:uncharacterized protein LOC142059576 n=1 Tax=Phalacrocorax aristotelis TaxID=126867 RepID=UPI003F4B9D28